jgi:hypothetical protein
MFGERKIWPRREKPRTQAQQVQDYFTRAEQERAAAVERQRTRSLGGKEEKENEEAADTDTAPAHAPSGSGQPSDQPRGGALPTPLEKLLRAPKGSKGKTFSDLKSGLDNTQQAELIIALKAMAQDGDRDAEDALNVVEHRATWAVRGQVKRKEEEAERAGQRPGGQSGGRTPGRQTRSSRRSGSAVAPAIASGGNLSRGEKWKLADAEFRRRGGGSGKVKDAVYKEMFPDG